MCSSDLGSYLLALGPTTDGEVVQLDVQGIPTITGRLPDINLVPLWEETDSIIQGKEVLPSSVGGDEVGLLIGIKAAKLGPKLMYTLPSGLGVYKSPFVDVYGSSVCFGGTHPVITDAYRNRDYTVNTINTFLTELARAYVRGPRTFVCAEVDAHGPEANPERLCLEGEFDSAEGHPTCFSHGCSKNLELPLAPNPML